MGTPQIYDLHIDIWRPDTLPMGWLATYLSKLADLFGDAAHVHFAKIRRGSAIPEVHVDAECAGEVFERLRLVASGQGPADAMRAQRDLNTELRQDDASAVLRVKGGARILLFPGRKTPIAQEVSSMKRES